MRFLLVGTSLSALALAVSVPVSAQDVVMRRPLPISNQSGNAGWQTSEFRPVDSSGNPVLPQNACGLYTERRDVWCDNDKGERVDEYFCSSEPKPADNRPQFHDSGCSYSWDQTAWNDPGDSCTLTETQTRSVTCRRDLDNAVVNDDKCSAAKPASTQILPDFSTCSHSWKTDAYADNGPSCTLAEVQNRNVWCERDLDGTTVDGMCDAGTRPAGSQTVEDIRSCTYTWSPGAWVDPGNSCTKTETQTRDILCKRDLDNSDADDSLCDAGTRPAASQVEEDFTGCTYSRVNPGAWTYANSCSANTSRSRVYECRRADGEIVAGSVCAANGVDVNETENGVSEYSSCTKDWDYGAWIPTQFCTATDTQTRSVQCKRDLDDAVLDDSECVAGSRLPSSQIVPNYSGCSYSAANWTAWTPASTCSANTTETRTAQCQRGDGTIMPASECTSRGVALSETRNTSNYSSCTNSWATGSFVDPANSCTKTETQIRSVWCKRDLDNALKDDTDCNAANRPANSQVVEDYSGCGYDKFNPTAWTYASTCSTNTSRTRTYQCQRSDGTIMDDSVCTNRGVSLSDTETGQENLTSCGYSAANPSGWTYASTCSANTSRTQTFQCQRSDGTIVAGSECTSRSIPLSVTQTGQENYTSCSYNGSSSQSSCSNGYQNVDYTCTRSDGQIVGNSNCGLPTGTQQAACSSYSWQTGGWSGWSACSGGTQTQTRSVICQEKTGAATATVSDSFCGGGKPAASQNQSCSLPSCMAAPRFRFRFGSGPEYSDNSSGSSVNWSSSSSCISQWVSSPGELYATARITNNGVTSDVRASITLNNNIQHGQSYSGYGSANIGGTVYNIQFTYQSQMDYYCEASIYLSPSVPQICS